MKYEYEVTLRTAQPEMRCDICRLAATWETVSDYRYYTCSLHLLQTIGKPSATVCLTESGE